MRETLRSVAEGLARKTTRRGLFGRGAELATGALIGVAAGSLAQAGRVAAGAGTVCLFPGPACPCDGCQGSGVCAKPCIISQCCYASGCWVSYSQVLQTNVTCCDCDCNGFQGMNVCGCGSDFHNDPLYCP